MTSWPANRCQEVKRLAALGLKCRAIGKELGVTKGAIIGIIHRMKHGQASIAWTPPPKSIPVIYIEPPPLELGITCVMEGCRGPRQPGRDRCAGHLPKPPRTRAPVMDEL